MRGKIEELGPPVDGGLGILKIGSWNLDKTTEPVQNMRDLVQQERHQENMKFVGERRLFIAKEMY